MSSKDKKLKVVTEAKPPKFELPQLKVDFLEGEALQAIKDKTVAKKSKVSPAAVSMSERMLKDIAAGARINLDSPQLLKDKEQVKKLLRRDLFRIAKRAGRRYNVKAVDEGQSLVFYYEPRPEKKDKAAA